MGHKEAHDLLSKKYLVRVATVLFAIQLDPTTAWSGVFLAKGGVGVRKLDRVLEHVMHVAMVIATLGIVIGIAGKLYTVLR